jgi:hypothetical protein
MEKGPVNENPALENLGRFFHFEKFDPEPIVKKCKEDKKYREMVIRTLQDKIRDQENPEILDKRYREITGRLSGYFLRLREINDLSKEMVNDFFNENNISEALMIQNLKLDDSRDFTEKSLVFFDKKLSSTILALANDDFEYLRGFLTGMRENISEVKDSLDSEEFELLPRNQEKIEKLKERLALIENL